MGAYIQVKSNRSQESQNNRVTYSKVHHELAILSIAPSWAGGLRIAHHELAVHNRLNGDAAECCGVLQTAE